MKQSTIKFISIAILSAGVINALVQFFYNRSLWTDEVYIALNIIHKNSLELLNPLDYGQVAPILFLEITNLFTVISPSVEHGLRLLPLICYIASIFLFFKISTKLFKDFMLVIAALSMFCFLPYLIYYSSEAKQYMSDLFVGLLLIYTVLYFENSRKILAFVGLFAIGLSNVSIIILAALGLYLINIFNVNTLLINFKKYFLLFVIWAAGFFIYYIKFIHNHPLQSYMVAYWIESFLPTNIFSLKFWEFIVRAIHEIFSYFLCFGKIWVVAFALFIWGFFKQNRRVFILIFSTIFFHLILSAFKLYPFGGRLILYQIPIYIWGVMFGLQAFFELKIVRNFQYLKFVIPVFFVSFFSYQLFRNIPLKHEEIKDCIAFVNENITDNQKVYVYYGATDAIKFYKEINKINFGKKIIYGKYLRGETKFYYNDITLGNPNEIWLLFSHVYKDEDTQILKNLLTKYSIKKQIQVDKTSAYLICTINH